MLCAFYHNSRKHKKEGKLLTGFKEKEKREDSVMATPQKQQISGRGVAAQVFIWNKTRFVKEAADHEGEEGGRKVFLSTFSWA